MRPLGSIALLALAVAPGTSRAQQACVSPLGLRGLAPGDALAGEWSEYIEVRDGKATPSRGFRIVATEAAWRGRRLRWIELWFDRAGASAVRVASDGSDEVVQLKRGRAIYSLPTGAGIARPCLAGERSARGRSVAVRTAAGTFACDHLRQGRGRALLEVWASREVRPLGMVKASLPGGLGFELIGHGSGATSAFPEGMATAPLPTVEMVAGLLPSDPPRQGVPGGAPSACRANEDRAGKACP